MYRDITYFTVYLKKTKVESAFSQENKYLEIKFPIFSFLIRSLYFLLT